MEHVTSREEGRIQTGRKQREQTEQRCGDGPSRAGLGDGPAAPGLGCGCTGTVRARVDQLTYGVCHGLG